MRGGAGRAWSRGSGLGAAGASTGGCGREEAWRCKGRKKRTGAGEEEAGRPVDVRQEGGRGAGRPWA